VLRDGDLARIEVQLDGVVVDLFNVGGLQIAHHAQHGGADVRIEPLLQVEHDVIGGEFLTVVELDALLQVQGPLFDIRAGFPLIEQPGNRDVIVACVGEVLADLAHLVDAFDPGKASGMVKPLYAGGNGECAAALGAGCDRHRSSRNSSSRWGRCSWSGRGSRRRLCSRSGGWLRTP